VALSERVYTDESGIHDGAKLCIVAGYRGSPSQWKRFNREWSLILNKPQYKIRDGFHSNVFFNREKIHKHNPYRNWSDNKASKFLGELLGVIRSHKITPVGCALVVKDFKALSWGEQCVLVGYITKTVSRKDQANPQPYHLAVRGLVENSLYNVSHDTKLHFIISEQRELQQRALDGYSLLKETFEKYGNEKEKAALKQLKRMEVDSPKDWPGLQAADLLANRWNYTLMRCIPPKWEIDQTKFNPEHIKTMNYLAYRNGIMPIYDAAFLEQLFHDTGYSEEDRNRLRSAQRL